ncbi:hypothetical protein SteCoe_34108 [Stentor coeruleus]|uniref:Importin N-terminal domain-containing protein n=1 Tax=Stentor coeruleus TaxID=5963 RepID=A0A1R2AV81_9CILI|nr:hypothetical protein SteCoe_34108 [Stentor coeruleus]
MTSLDEILVQAQSLNQNAREIALTYLDQSAISNPNSLFQQLSQILLDGLCQKNIRILAAIYLKNNINKYWDTISSNNKDHIKANCISSLGINDLDLVKIGAITVSTLFLKELPKGLWKEGLDILITNSYNTINTYKHASLLTLGYICEDLNPEVLTNEEKYKILLATLSGMAQDNEEIQYVSITAFKNSVKFFEANFRNGNESYEILMSLYDNFKYFPVLAFQTIGEILTVFPEIFDNTLCTLGELTYNGIKSDNEDIALAAINVWNTIGDIEKYRLEIGIPLLGYLETACESLTELLLPKLLLPLIDDEWSVSKAAYNMMSSISVICEGQNSQQVSRFIKEHIYSKSYMKKSLAGILALSSLYEESTEVHDNFREYFSQVIKLFNSPHEDVQKHAFWCFSRFCKNSNKDLDEKFIIEAQEKLLKFINCEGKSNPFACWGLKAIYQRYSWILDINQCKCVIETLLKIITQENKYRTEYYELITSILNEIPDNYINIIELLFTQFLNFYTNNLLNNDLYNIYISNTLQIILTKLPANRLTEPIIDKTLNSIILFLNIKSTLYEESLQLLGALAINTGPNFSSYLPKVSSYLLHSITILDSSGIIKSGIIAIGDIARTLGSEMPLFIEKAIPSLLIILENPNILITCKILSINCLGDIANAVNQVFLPYMPIILKYLDGAAGISLQITNDADLNENLYELRESIIQFYICLIQGLAKNYKQNLIQERLSQLNTYIGIIIQDKFSPTPYLHQCILGLIIDLIENYKDYKLDTVLFTYIKSFSKSCNGLCDAARIIMSLCN